MEISFGSSVKTVSGFGGLGFLRDSNCVNDNLKEGKMASADKHGHAEVVGKPDREGEESEGDMALEWENGS